MERLQTRHVSLAGTLDNCCGGPTPWDTWLTCEETDAILDLPDGYVFEVDPRRGGNPDPIRALGRFEHEAVSFGRDGTVYLTRTRRVRSAACTAFGPSDRSPVAEACTREARSPRWPCKVSTSICRA